MSGKIVFRNVMGILLPGVNSIISERTNQIYGQLIEKAVMLSLEIIILVLEKDLTVSDFWRPLYQVFNVSGFKWYYLVFVYPDTIFSNTVLELKVGAHLCIDSENEVQMRVFMYFRTMMSNFYLILDW